METPTCSSCPFWDRIDYPKGCNQGSCRRYPPRPMLEPDDDHFDSRTTYTLWLKTDGADWCGEHPDLMKWWNDLGNEP